ncbi:uncharacterized protein LOC132301628 [Cornus florida]|uniref:uncharacterized protein LOC132301628 n=1 Tax=Cornus florida TaxID=4283 RepID=UPI00289E3D0B|nr:uncharacterized protein LOC132301628 [Cornus florida]
MWSPVVMVKLAVTRLWEYVEVRLQCRRMFCTKSSTSSQSWIPSLPGLIKCNVDACFSVESSVGEGGAIFRDYSSSIIQLVVFKPFPSSSVLVTEAVCLRRAISWAKSLHFLNVCFESDAKLLVDAVADDGNCSIKIASLIFDIKKALKVFPSATVSHVRRAGNRVAHALASLSWDPMDSDWILPSVPPSILDLAAQ